MSLKSLSKKAGMTLGGLLLTCNIGCKSLTYPQSAVDVKSTHTDLEDEADFQRLIEQENLENTTRYPTSYKPKMWHYFPPLNIMGGLLLRDFTHESSHAITALATGMEIEDFHPVRFIPGKYSDEICTGWIKITDESYRNASNSEISAVAIAGPLSDMALAEVINYNLRNGKISPGSQPFWATTSLVYRWCSLGNALFGVGIWGKQVGNDFNLFAEKTGISEETSAGIITLHTILSAKRIVKEIKVALGCDMYPINEKQKGRVDLFPYKDGLHVRYTLNF